MALISNDRYVRVDSLRVGKNVMQFIARIYDKNDLNSTELSAKLITCAYSLDSENGNPFQQAYKYLSEFSEFKDFVSDVITNESKMAQQNKDDFEILKLPANDLIVSPTTPTTNNVTNDIVESDETKNKKSRKRKTNVLKG